MIQQDEIDSKSLLEGLIAFKRGDYSYRMPNDLTGISGKIADTFNDIIESQQNLLLNIMNVSQTVGR
jgi:hypothetical protein